jgi:hypothetical protein
MVDVLRLVEVVSIETDPLAVQALQQDLLRAVPQEPLTVCVWPGISVAWSVCVSAPHVFPRFMSGDPLVERPTVTRRRFQSTLPRGERLREL